MSPCGCQQEASHLEVRALVALLLINALLFVTEAFIGWLAQSTGLLADSLDMLADASVYGIALYAVGRSKLLQRQAAAASGVLQILLGAGVLFEVVRRYWFGSEPASVLMIAMGCVALVGNISCLLLLAKHRHAGVHMRASWIFSTNDVLANIGVILSGIAVSIIASRLPDLLIGTVIAIIVIRGGIQILGESAIESKA